MSEQTENKEKRPIAENFQVKVYPEEIKRFESIMSMMDGVNTKGQAFVALLDNWDNPPKTVIKDNPALVQKIAELEAEADKRTQELTDLRAKLETTQKEANTNGQASSQLQLRIDELEKENAALREKKNVPENVITLEVHPVAWYFLNEMSKSETKRTGKPVEPGKILAELFFRDLQNPRSNNLPYTVSTAEIKDVAAKYEALKKKKAEAEQKETEQKPAGQEAQNGD